ncbi:MAG: cobalamin-dependent protein [Rhodospirillales bacterium]|nr:cobalamin-dependent protein [Rhodospirillales bacterium]
MLAGDRRAAANIVEVVLAENWTAIDIYERLFRQALYRVGELWERNKISVATEHVASAIVESLMGRIYPEIISKKRIGLTGVVACSEREQHQIGARMACDVFEMRGWDAKFVGINVPRDALLGMLDEINPDVCALSICLDFNLDRFLEMITDIRSRFRNLPILVGGQAIRDYSLPFKENYPGVTQLGDLGELNDFLKGWEAGHR